jgi:hypothetical protein
MLRHRHQEEEAFDRPSETPALVVGSVIGAAGLVVGSYALLRVGVNTRDLSRPTVTVLDIEHTPVLALAEVGFGALMILAAMTPRLGRVAIGLLSATLVAFGTAQLSAARTSGLHHWFGVVHHQGWSFVIIGTVGLLATLTFPTMIRQTIVRREPAAHPNDPAADFASPTSLASADTPAIGTPVLSGDAGSAGLMTH